ncbi:MAG: sigma-54-dependent Fis family transcriptional regulator [Acidobacteria bacterium]|nr:MAG: sigma-54-dependent Fis family transcriptional regulator [Acidobacteriota bacterium]
MTFRILIVDDEQPIRQTLSFTLRRQNYDVDQASNRREALERLETNNYDLILLDMRLNGDSGMDLLRYIKKTYPQSEVMMITAFGTVATAVEAMKLGACDYITKPFNRDELLHRVKNVLRTKQLESEVKVLRQEFEEKYGLDNIVGRSKELMKVLALVRKVAPTDTTVLITGETGTGKDLIARAIHALSRRSERPFVSINCAAFPEHLLESELFGYVKGAFTGAINNRKGLLQEADGGTFFFDEIGSMPLPLQTKLLRVIEDKMVRRLGENKPTHVDVRIIAATNNDLYEAVRAQQFREDLFYRLNVVNIHMPPLRARRADIPELANYFLNKYARRDGREGLEFSQEVLALLINYDFPGNVRELAHIVEHAVTVCPGPLIRPEDLPQRFRERSAASQPVPLMPQRSRRQQLEEEERRLIIQAIKASSTIREAAEALGMSRATLWRRMKKYGLSKRLFVE